MACDVDELDINPFFRALQNKFSDLYNHAQEKCYTVCIPQSTTIQGTVISKDFVETHILKPSPYFKGEFLTSHSSNSKAITLADDGCSITTGKGFQSVLRVRIVSEEIAYNKVDKQYRILIIDQPLDPKFQHQTTTDDVDNGQNFPTRCVTLTECRTFLDTFPEFRKALQKVDERIKVFNSNYMVLPDYLMDAASRLSDISSEAVTNCVKCAGRQLVADAKWRDALVTAMESYVMSEAYKKVFGVVLHRCTADDRCLQHKCKEQLKGISAEALGIQPSFACPLPEAIEELNKMDQLTTPREKLNCLKSVIDAVTSGIKAHLSHDIPPHLAPTADTPCLTSDDLIPILVNVIGQSDCKYLQSGIVYMETFSWASSANDMDDLSYCLVTFKAAVQYILSTDFSRLPQKNSHRKQASMDRLSAAADRLTISNGRGDRTPSPRHSPTPLSSMATAGMTTPGNDRLERQMSRISKVLDERSQGQAKGQKEQKVKSIFGAEYDVPVALETTARSRASPQLGDFLSSLQDDFMDQPYGKQT